MISEASGGAGAQVCGGDATVVGSSPILINEWHHGKKPSIEIRNSSTHASTMRGKVGNGVFNTRFPLPTLLCVGYSVKLIKIKYFVISF